MTRYPHFFMPRPSRSCGACSLLIRIKSETQEGVVVVMYSIHAVVPTNISFCGSLDAQKRELLGKHKMLVLGVGGKCLTLEGPNLGFYEADATFVDRGAIFSEVGECPAFYVPTLHYLYELVRYNCTDYRKMLDRVFLHLSMKSGCGDPTRPMPKRSVCGRESEKHPLIVEAERELPYNIERIPVTIYRKPEAEVIWITSDLPIARLMCLPLCEPSFIENNCILDSTCDSLRLTIINRFLSPLRPEVGQFFLPLSALTHE